MSSNTKSTSKTDESNLSYSTTYNPWNLLFKPRNRTNSEHSVTSTTSSQGQIEPPAPGFREQVKPSVSDFVIIKVTVVVTGARRIDDNVFL
ncbi:hypothetical protein EVAR_63329_1 [Eumeta japonica]|uniref:Uncharacterized protein n=1 Tax=Eumeta variegata TaxID=151549 RepID=A0A4C1YQ03_EUMVA|nr:hypothetical protein EVAR_63329_1 [Eumeta japonica]